MDTTRLQHRSRLSLFFLLFAAGLLLSGCAVVWAAPGAGVTALIVALLLALAGCTDSSSGGGDSGTADDGTATLPTISIADVTVTEADGTASFTVTKTGTTEETVTVDYATADGTALVDGDYSAASGTLTYSPAETEQTVTVTIIDDAIDEADETFTVTVSVASNADAMAEAISP